MEHAIYRALWYEALSSNDLADRYASAGTDLMENLPDVPSEYEKECQASAREFVLDCYRALTGKTFNHEGDDDTEDTILECFNRFEPDDYAREWPISAELFGHYAVMQAHGEGVGLWEFAEFADTPLERFLGSYELPACWNNAVFQLEEELDEDGEEE